MGVGCLKDGRLTLLSLVSQEGVERASRGSEGPDFKPEGLGEKEEDKVRSCAVGVMSIEH